MRGIGSSNWERWQRKTTVEESLVFDLKAIRKQLFVGVIGAMTWRWGKGSDAIVAYQIARLGGLLTLVLRYRWRDIEDVILPIQLSWTEPHFGGRRAWLWCPILMSGVACEGRMNKLYLPPQAKYFGCRKCHDLSYRSSQEAHQTERALARFGLDPELAELWKKRSEIQ